MQNATCQDRNAQSVSFMTFDHDQDQDPATVAYTRELFACFSSQEDHELVAFMKSEARSYLGVIHDDLSADNEVKTARSRRQWLLHLLSVAEYSLQLLRLFMARVIVESRSTATA